MNEIETLLAWNKIETQLYLYCKGVDQRDWALVKSCFGDEHVHHHQSFSGSMDEFIVFASRTMEIVKTSQHSLANVMVSISDDGLSASSEAYFSAIHFIDGRAVSGMHFETNGLHQDTDWIVAGTYKDKWVFRDGGWLIIERHARHTWERVEPASQPVKL